MFVEKVLDQKRDIISPLAQRWQIDLDDIQPELEILTK